MNEEQHVGFWKLFEGLGLLEGSPIISVGKPPKQVAQEILNFRAQYNGVDFTKVLFHTYDLRNMVIGVAILRAMKDTWESRYPQLATTHEVTLSVYPAMDTLTNAMNFYFIPTWITKGGFRAGLRIEGEIIDFALRLNDTDLPYLYEKDYIYDLGSSCP